ncbi:MAG TPA: hypothetical protein VKW06_05135 [Candidatus Angelobacter sp.]|nr:hypothetical protein [Candidatus Angelobacter sp.]
MYGIRQITTLLLSLATASPAWSQRLPSFGSITPQEVLEPVATMHPAPPPCAKKNEPFDMDDYDGPFNKLIARYSQKIDRVTVHAPSHRHTGLKPCSLSAGEKFRLWVDDSVDPVNFITAGWSAGIDQAENTDPQYGQGAAGYSQRYAAELADNATGGFFGIFLYPTIFHQDPRYYRLGHGSTGERLGHALRHRFAAVSDSGKRVPNYPEWFSVVSTKLVTNLYHPGNPRGFGPTAQRVGFNVGNDMAWDVLREFWPEIAHKFKLPFRTHEDETAANRLPLPRQAQASQTPSTGFGIDTDLQ